MESVRPKAYQLAHFVIIEHLRRQPATTSELRDVLKKHNLPNSEKQPVRYINQINELFDITIQKKIDEDTGKLNQKSCFELEDPLKNLDESNYINAKNFFISSLFYDTLAGKNSLSNQIQIDLFNNISVVNVNDILVAIKEKRIVRMYYLEYDEEVAKEIKIKPYLVKSYLNRWYCIGKTEEYPEGKAYSFDRIESLELLFDTFYNDDLPTIKQRYDEIIGVTHYKDAAPIKKVRIRFFENQFKYFKADPWVKSYETKIIDNEMNVVDVIFNVRENNELHQRILFNNEKLQVIEPKELADRIQEILINTLNRYKV